MTARPKHLPPSQFADAKKTADSLNIVARKVDAMDMRISGQLSQLQKQVSSLEEGQAELRKDVAGLKDDVAGLKDDVAGLKDDFFGMKEVQKTFSENQLDMNRKLNLIIAHLNIKDPHAS